MVDEYENYIEQAEKLLSVKREPRVAHVETHYTCYHCLEAKPEKKMNNAHRGRLNGLCWTCADEMKVPEAKVRDRRGAEICNIAR